MILAFLVAVTFLTLSRRKISHWHLKYEERRLKKLQSLIAGATEDREAKEYYQPFRAVLENRIQETKQLLKADNHARAGAFWHKKRV